MNLLAHAWLSFNQPEILVGNMISDYVKGKSKDAYPAEIQRGIMLHRAIDTFTDQHPVTIQAKQFFKPQYRLYAGAFIDVVYDHFLANDPYEFKDAAALEMFAQSAYSMLQQQQNWLQPKFFQMLPSMISQNWLYHYRFKEGIEKGFGGLVRRAAYLHESTIAYAIFQQEYDHLQSYYNQFFPELKQYAQEWLQVS